MPSICQQGDYFSALEILAPEDRSCSWSRRLWFRGMERHVECEVRVFSQAPCGVFRERYDTLEVATTVRLWPRPNNTISADWYSWCASCQHSFTDVKTTLMTSSLHGAVIPFSLTNHCSGGEGRMKMKNLFLLCNLAADSRPVPPPHMFSRTHTYSHIFFFLLSLSLSLKLD